MEGEIINIERIFDVNTCKYGYTVVIDFEELPNLKLGKCEVLMKKEANNGKNNNIR